MSNGYVIVARSREDSGVRVEAIEEDVEEYLVERDMRIIYCQAVSDVEVVKDKIDRWLEQNDDFGHRLEEDINDLIAEMVSSLQWVANEHPLKSFNRCDGNTSSTESDDDDD